MVPGVLVCMKNDRFREDAVLGVRLWLCCVFVLNWLPAWPGGLNRLGYLPD